jgi:hypothetical protein
MTRGGKWKLQNCTLVTFGVDNYRETETSCLADVFFFRITQYIGDTHNARTLIPMNRRTQTLPL